MNKNERGPGYWKLNCSLLHEQGYVEQIKNKIATYKTTHMHSVTLWENLKNYVRKISKKYSRSRQNENRLIISQLIEKVAEMESRLPLPQDQDQVLIKTKLDLDQKVDENTKGIIFRSKVRWVEEGEKSTKYFFNLEKARYNAKTSHTLINEKNNNEVVTNDDEILKLQKEHYQELYSKDDRLAFNLQNDTDIGVSKEDFDLQSKEIEFTEIAEAIKGMANGKTPGDDGLPVEFYKIFYHQIKHHLLNMINTAFLENRMPESSIRGVLNLIPKPGKDTRYVKNLCPITLLNTDYKIIEKIIANRMKNSMNEIIHSDQRGFLPGRRIAANIRKIYDLMEYTKQNDIEAIVLSLDYKSCFDLISFESIIESLKYFGFLPWIIDWTSLLYTDYTVRIQNNGHFSENIKIERSVHQGGVNSVNLFLCVAEILAINLRKNKNIKGIPVNEIINLLNQYADDMDVSMLANEENIQNVLNEIDIFHKATGFTINIEKSKIFRMGSIRDSDAKFIAQKEVAWTNDPINVLGVWICHNEEDIIEKNYVPLIEKIKTILNKWKSRTLSLLGKIMVINTLIGSLFVYKMTVLPSIPERIVKHIEALLINFIWGGNKAKIPLDVLQRDKTEGGLKLLDIRLKDYALKISWIQILYNEESLANLAHEFIHPILKSWIFDCNLSKRDIEVLNITSPFWKDVMTAWCVFNYDPDTLKVIDQPIWYNSNIRIGGKPFFYENYYKRGLFKISQLWHNAKVISVRQAFQDFGLNFLDFHAIITAIPNEIKNKIIKNKDQPYVSNYAKCLDKSNLSSWVYGQIISVKDSSQLVKTKDKWETKISRPISTEDFYKKVSNIYVISNIPRYRSFQYRLMNRAIVLNKDLKQWKIKASDECSLCEFKCETIEHFFFECEIAKKIWSFIVDLVKEYDPTCEIVLSLENVLFNEIASPPKCIANVICLITKQYMYRQRCLGKLINLNELRGIVYKCENTEKYIAIKSGKINKHNKKWYLKKEKNQDQTLDIETFARAYLENKE